MRRMAHAEWRTRVARGCGLKLTHGGQGHPSCAAIPPTGWSRGMPGLRGRCMHRKCPRAWVSDISEDET